MSLGIIANRPGSRLPTVDPVTSPPYEFEATGPRTFRLCAVFTTDTAVAPVDADSDWHHGSERQCFDLKASRQ